MCKPAAIPEWLHLEANNAHSIVILFLLHRIVLDQEPHVVVQEGVVGVITDKANVETTLINDLTQAAAES